MWTLLLLATFLLLLLLISRSKKSGGQLQKLDFLPDVVYLVQFPVSPFIRSISPFALKLETYLRLKKVKYEPVYSLHFGKKRQIPYVEINGEHIPDSNVIIKELEKRGIATPDDHLSQEQKAANHVASICIENHTCLAGFLWRYGAHMEEFYGKLCEANFGKARDLFFFKHFMPFGMRLKGKFHGLGRHSPEEIQEFSFQDLKAISVMLGDKPYFNGQVRPFVKQRLNLLVSSVLSGALYI